jgi:hypothetical protein
MREEEFVSKIKALLADEHDCKESAFDNLVPQMRAAFAKEGSISEDDLTVLFHGSDDDDLPDLLADKYPLIDAIASSIEDDDDDD